MDLMLSRSKILFRSTYLEKTCNELESDDHGEFKFLFETNLEYESGYQVATHGQTLPRTGLFLGAFQ
jgi:hypothetical protein